jgi:Rieske Fe-S protein
MDVSMIRIFLLISLFSFNAHADSNLHEVDLSKMTKRGQLMYVETDGRPVWVLYRTLNSIQDLEKRSHLTYSSDPDNIKTNYRSLNKDYFVVFGGCPEASELPNYYPDNGFSCKSNCTEFDMAGRPKNNCSNNKPMDIPVHYFKNTTTIVVPTNQDKNT